MRPLGKVNTLPFLSGLRRLFDGRESSKNYALTAYLNVRHPSIFVSGHAGNAARIVFIDARAVPSILGSIGQSEIVSSVVERIAVNVINANRIAYWHPKNNAVQSDLRRCSIAHAGFVEMPFFSFDQRNIGRINDSACAIKANFDESNIPIDRDSRGVIAFSSLTGVYCG